MCNDFYRDLKAAKPAELLTLKTLSAAAPQWDFKHIGEDKKYYSIGDIKAINRDSGEVVYIEVKDDKAIWKTHNVLCEEQNYFYDSREYKKGNMYSDY